MTDSSWVTNMTNNTAEYFFHSFTNILGADVFFTIFFGAIGLFIFIKSNKNMGVTIGYFLLVQTFIAVWARSPFSIFILILISFMSIMYGYNTFFRKNE